ncbi:MAG: hypothetical protein SPL73_05620 [Cyanobacteriota bacterium]|nr:hypothetical protein [Cyanobacteriota bacterium]MDY6364350.1 hypothetical protein [Cyanobacteriota bacterium]
MKKNRGYKRRLKKYVHELIINNTNLINGIRDLKSMLNDTYSDNIKLRNLLNDYRWFLQHPVVECSQIPDCQNKYVKFMRLRLKTPENTSDIQAQYAYDPYYYPCGLDSHLEKEFSGKFANLMASRLEFKDVTEIKE